METTTATAETAVAPPPAQPQPYTSAFRYNDEQLVQLVAALEEPFDPREIKWRVTNTTSDRRRGQVIAYADPRAYTDRLNAIFTIRGWTREYSIQVIQNFERVRAWELRYPHLGESRRHLQVDNRGIGRAQRSGRGVG